MRNKILFCIFVIPTLALIYAICCKKSAPSGASGTSQSGVFRLDGKLLHQTQNIWTNRSFIQVVNHDAIHESLENLTEELTLSISAKSNAVESCFGMIKAYSSGDWDVFQSFRTPIPDFEVNAQGIATLIFVAKKLNAANAADIATTNATNMYLAIWKQMFINGGFFNGISFVSNSVSTMEMPLSDIQKIRIPAFTGKTNENYVMATPNVIFDYSKHLSAQQPGNVKILRLFFVATSSNETNLYMILFALDEKSDRWLPCRLSISYALARSLHKIPIF